jgi:hypothetical protein
MKKQFCCDASQDLYEKYYLGQSGNGMPVFVGSRGQRGHGLGSMLSGLFRNAMPLIRRGLGTIGKQALKTGVEIVNDVSEGRSVKEAAKRRVGEGIKRFASDHFTSSQPASAKRRKVKRSKTNKKRHNDIFN